jgi:HEAT repeat protein
MNDEASLARALAGEIVATGSVGEVAGAVQRLAALLDDPALRTHPASLDAWVLAVKALDPASAAGALQRWLVDHDSRLRLAAISGLGLLQHDSATDPLTAELISSGNPSDIRQAAAGSLTEIGSARATDALLRAYKIGDDATKKAVASAIMASGDAALQQSLKQLM